MITKIIPVRIQNNYLQSKCSNPISFAGVDTFEYSNEDSKERIMFDKLIKEMEDIVNEQHPNANFRYPEKFKEYDSSEKLESAGWSFPKGKNFLTNRMQDLKVFHKVDNLVPFAEDEEGSEMACFVIDNAQNDKVTVVWPFASTENLYQGEYEDITEWFEEGI